MDTAWTEVTDLNTARSNLGGYQVCNTDTLIFGGATTAKLQKQNLGTALLGLK